MAHRHITAHFEAIPVSFFSMCVRVDAIRRCYPGGLVAFDRHYPEARRSARLRAIASMCFGEAEDMLRELEGVGLDVGADIAIAEMMYGEIQGAPGIQLVDVGEHIVPCWLYVASNHPAHEEVGR